MHRTARVLHDSETRRPHSLTHPLYTLQLRLAACEAGAGATTLNKQAGKAGRSRREGPQHAR